MSTETRNISVNNNIILKMLREFCLPSFNSNSSEDIWRQIGFVLTALDRLNDKVCNNKSFSKRLKITLLNIDIANRHVCMIRLDLEKR